MEWNQESWGDRGAALVSGNSGRANSRSSFFTVFLAVCQAWCISSQFSSVALAQATGTESSPGSVNGTETTTGTAVPGSASVSTAVPIDLNLASTDRNLTAGNLTQNQAISILVGGENRIITSETMLTPAERLATYQVFSTGQQSILLSDLGAAIGGTFNIGPKFASYVASLTIPEGVTAIKDFGTASTLSLLGNLVNNGSFVGFSSNSAVNSGTISATNILNNPTGLITTNIPTSLIGALNSVVNLNLNLVATESILNSGLISSSGALSMTAPTIVNSQSVGSLAMQLPTIQALGDINLTVTNLINSGLIASQAANINFRDSLSDITINGTNGIFEAIAGAINIRDENFLAKNDLSIVNGPNMMSQELNLFSGGGRIEVDAGLVTGRVNITAHEIEFHANSPNVRLGDITATGDPLFTNTGTYTITGNISTAGAPLAIVAGADIVTSGPGYSISTANTTGNGGTILLAAGTNWTSTATTLTFNGTNASETGGSISLGNIIDLDSRGGTAAGTQNANGGNITLVAYANTAGTSGGTITLPSTLTARTGGDGTGTNGNFVAIAGRTGLGSGNSITLGNIETSFNATTTGGTVSLTTAQPTGTVSVTVATGAIASSSLAPSGTLTNSSISTGAITTNGGAININSGHSYTTNNNNISSARIIGTGVGGVININANGGDLNIGSSNDVISSGVDATSGVINLNSGAALTVRDVTSSAISSAGSGAAGAIVLASLNTPTFQNITANGAGAGAGTGGTVSVITGGNIDSTGNISAQGTGTGTAGSIALRAGAQYTVNTSVSTTGESASGGFVNVGSISTRATGSTGTGGTVSIAAYEGTGPVSANSGAVLTGNIDLRGAGTSNNGALTIIAGDATANGANSLTTGTIDARGGSGTSGAILLATGNPTGSLTITRSTGAIATNTIGFDPAAMRNGSISTGNITTNGASVSLFAGHNITSGAIDSSRTSGTGSSGFILAAGGLNNTNGSDIIVQSLESTGVAGSAGAISAFTTRNINVNGNILALGSPTTAGGAISLVAGGTPGITGTTVTAPSSESNTGGRIDVGGALGVSTSGTVGGAITLVALQGTTTPAASSGRVILSSGGITSTGSTTNGNVLVVAGDADAAGALVLRTGAINTAQGPSGGTVTLGTTSALGTISISRSTGAVSATTLAINPSALQNGTINTLGITTQGAAINILAGNVYSSGNSNISSARTSGTGVGGAITINAGNDLSIGLNNDVISSGVDAGSGAVNLLSGGTLTVRDVITSGVAPTGTAAANGIVVASVNTPSFRDLLANGAGTAAGSGGTISVITGGNISTTGNISAQASGTGNAGAIALRAGYQFTVSATQVSTTGPSASGGQIALLGNLSTLANGTGGGGAMSLAATQGTGASAPLSGTISIQDADLRSGGTGTNGSFLAIAGDADAAGANTLSTGNINSRGGTILGTVFLGTSEPTGALVITRSSGAIATNALAFDPNFVRDGSISTGNITTNGGSISLYSGNHIASSNVDSSKVNGIGAAGFIAAASGLANTGAGSINMQNVLANGNSGAGASIALLSRGDISVTGQIASTGSLTSSGAAVLLVAGGNVSTTATTNAVSGGSSSGGRIQIGGTGINTISGATGGSGGAVTLIAYQGTTTPGTDSGTISLPAMSTIVTKGVTTNNGSVLLVAEDADAAGANSITTGNIDTAGTATASGTISLNTTIATGTVTLTRSTGAFTSTLAPTPTSVQPASISTGALTTNGASVTALAGQNFSTNNNNVSSARASGTGAGGAINIYAVAGNLLIGANNDVVSSSVDNTAGTINLISGNTLTVRDVISSATSAGGSGAAGGIVVASVNTPTVRNLIANGAGAGAGAGGAISVITGGDIAPTGTISLTGSGTGSGGTLALRAGVQFTVSPTQVLTTTASSTGGRISVNDLSTRSIGNTGGSISIAAYQGSGPVATNSGQILTGNIDLRSGGAGNNGALLIVAGDADAAGGTTITTGTINSAGGTGAGGTVLLATTEPTGGLTVTRSSGTITSTLNMDVTAFRDGSISSGTITTNGGNTSLFAGHNVSLTGNTIDTSRVNGAGDAGFIIAVAGLTNSSGSNFTAQNLTANGFNGAGGNDAGEISIIASANIDITGDINARGFGSGVGEEVTLLAGVTPTVNSTTVAYSSESATGGFINIGGAGGINTSSPATAGSVLLMATQGTTTPGIDSGKITMLPSSTVTATGTTANGTVLMLAGDADAAGANTVSIGAINTALGTSGAITLGTTSATGTASVSRSSGAVTTTLAMNTADVRNASISTQGLTTNGANINILAGQNYTTNSNSISTSRIVGTGAGGSVYITALQGSVLLGATNDISTLGVDSLGGNVGLIAGNTVTVRDITTSTSSSGVSASGGGIYIASVNTPTFGNLLSAGTGTAGTGGSIAIITSGDIITTGAISTTGTGGAGNVGLRAGLDFTLSPTLVTATTQSATGGQISVGNLTARSTGASAVGGVISLAAYEGSGVPSANSGKITAGNLDTRGTGTSTGGAITIVAGDTSAGGGVSLNIGNITSRGSSGTSGAVTLGTTTPTGAFSILRTTGAITSTLALDSASIQNASISSGSITTNGGAVTILAGADFTSNNSSISAARAIGTGTGGAVRITASGAINIGTTADIETSGLDSTSGVVNLVSGSLTIQDVITSGVAVGGTSAAGGVSIASIGSPIFRNILANGAGSGAGTGGPVSVISEGSITPTGTISTLGAGTGSGGPMALVAGVQYTVTATGITTAGQSASGGEIQLGNIDTRATGTSGSGGGVTLAAFQGSSLTPAANSGRITLGNVEMRGVSTGANGSLIAVAGDADAAGASSLIVGTINSRGGFGAAGVVQLGTSNPGGGITVSRSTGTITTSSITTDFNTLRDASVSSGSITTNGGRVAVFAGHNINMTGNTIDTSRQPGATGTAGAIILGAGLVNTSGSDVNVNSLIANGEGTGTTATGNAISVFASRDVNIASTVSAMGADTASGASVLLVAGSSPTLNATSLLSGAQGFTGGQIIVGGAGIMTNSGPNGGSGGAAILIAYQGTSITPAANSGRITLPGASTISTSGQGTNNGNILVIGGDSDAAGANSITLGTLNTSGAAAANGNISIGTTTPTGSGTSSRTSGAITSTFALTPGSVQPASISTGSLTTNGAAITVLTGQDFTTNGNAISSSRTTGTTNGGAITLTATGGFIAASMINALGPTNGGAITINSRQLRLTGTNGNGSSIDASGTTGIGGTVGITTTANDKLIVGAAPGPNGTAGHIFSNGTDGGFITLSNTGSQQVNTGAIISANGTTGTGGKVLLQLSPAGSAAYNVVNNGLIQATSNSNTTGRIGFNSGAGQNLTLTGIGSLLGGEFVAFGNLNTTTVDLTSPGAGIVSYSQASILNSIRENGLVPPTPVVTEPPMTQTNTNQGLQFNLTINNDDVPSNATIATDKVLMGPIDLNGSSNAVMHLASGTSNGTRINGVIIYDSEFNTSTLNNLQAQRTLLVGDGSHGHIVSLQSGNAVFSPAEDIVVLLPNGRLNVAGGTTVFVMVDGDNTSVYNLHDEHKRAAIVSAGGTSIELAPGEMALLSSKPSKPDDRIPWRNLKKHSSNNDVEIASAEFSLASAFTNIDPLFNLLSSNSPKDQKLVSKLVKNAAIISMLRGRIGPYDRDRQ